MSRESTLPPQPPPAVDRPAVPQNGKWVVVALFVFAGALTAANWVYWELHVGPFAPLQKQLDEQFPGSQPRVEGGQRKIHKETPKVLRVTMKIDFDPSTKTGEYQAKSFAAEVSAFVASAYPQLADYQILELHFFQPQPEKQLKKVETTYEVSTLLGD